MALDKYREKRSEDKTPEPFGGKGTGKELRFVVQKHDASHLHYDFRLEMDGVLKSWAVPKGPSLDPEVKRLAMMVEDHPYDYRDFEGVIPKGQYGGGTVIVWDEGTYEAAETVEGDLKKQEKNLLHQLHKGKLKIKLNGEKLKGEFALNILSRGDSIGESLLFGKKNYPMYAVAKTDCTVIKLAKSSFLELVRTNRDISVQLLEQLSDRLYYKYTMLFNNSSMNATAKITSLLDYYKECAMSKGRYNYHLPLTRQQIANLTGLRVETVIRTIKKMEAEEIIHINERQIYY